MKIIIATGLYPPEIGGPATYTKMLEKHLPQHGFTLTIVPFGWVRHYPKFIRHLIYTWKLYKGSKNHDLIYALDPVSVGLPALLASKIRSLPLLLRIAGDYAWEQGQNRYGVRDTLDEFIANKNRYPVQVLVMKYVERYVACRAKHVVVPSDYMKNIIKNWDVPDSHITRIYSALFPIDVKESRETLRTQFNYRNMVVTTAARLVPWKGIHRLIDAIAILGNKGTDITLIVIGDGPLLDELKTHATEKGIEERVRFVGRQTKDALGAAIKASDIFVLNTSYEGLSHQLLEVMDLGVPIIATPVGGNMELIKDGTNGLFVPFNDAKEIAKAIERIGENESLRQHLVQHARAHVKNFSKEKVITELVELLKVIVSHESR